MFLEKLIPQKWFSVHVYCSTLTLHGKTSHKIPKKSSFRKWTQICFWFRKNEVSAACSTGKPALLTTLPRNFAKIPNNGVQNPNTIKRPFVQWKKVYWTCSSRQLDWNSDNSVKSSANVSNEFRDRPETIRKLFQFSSKWSLRKQF